MSLPRQINLTTRKGLFGSVVVAAVILVLISGIALARWYLAKPQIVLLLPEAGADWIGVSEPFDVIAHSAGPVSAAFRTEFQLDGVPPNTVLTIHALKFPTVLLDGHVIYEAEEDVNWKVAHKLELSRQLTAGRHVLQINVRNQNGPCAVLVHSGSIGLFSGGGWQVSRDLQNWTGARRLSHCHVPLLSLRFPRADQGVHHSRWLLSAVFLVVFLLAWIRNPERKSPLLRMALSPSGIRFCLLIAWFILAANNFRKIPAYVGCDVQDHRDYVSYVAERGRVPLATEGMQMFQSPLYYLIAAPTYRLLSVFVNTPANVWQILRWISLLSGAMQVELCYRTMKHVWPGRPELQRLGTVIGGLLPMNLYSSQVIGNEPLAGCLTGAVLLLSFNLLCVPPESRSKWMPHLLGLMLGLALLTKFTAVLLLPVMVIVVPYAWAVGAGWKKPAARAVVTVFGIALVVSGWYYARNWLELGRPFVGGWDPERGIVWWQDPGYRTPEQFFRFGEALNRPVYSGVCGFWDAFYSTFWLDGWLSGIGSFRFRPPWNYGLMLSGAWLAVLPTLGIVVGAVLAVCCPARLAPHGLRLAIGCVSLYLAAVLMLFLQLPIYSTVKATYTLGLIPCYAVLGTAGLSVLMRGPVSRAAVQAGIACWGVAAYLAYFVV